MEIEKNRIIVLVKKYYIDSLNNEFPQHPKKI